MYDSSRTSLSEWLEQAISVEEMTALALAWLWDDPNPKHGSNFEVPWDWKKQSLEERTSKKSSPDQKKEKKN